MSASDLSKQAQLSSGQDASADLQRREALIKLGKYTAYATPVLLATVTAAPPLVSAVHLTLLLVPLS